LSFLFSIFAGLALVLATIGLYGLLAYTTLKRVREIGIRLALGARPSQIRTLILSHGMHLLLIGSAIGLVCAVAVSRALQAFSSKSTGSTRGSISALARCFLPRLSSRPGSRPGARHASIQSSLYAKNRSYERPSLRVSPTPKITRIHFRGGANTRAGDLREYGDFFVDSCSFFVPSALFHAAPR